MKPELLGKLAEDTSFWRSGKVKSPGEAPKNGSSGISYLRKAAKAYRTKNTGAKALEKSSTEPATAVDDSLGMADVTSDASSGLATPPRETDADNSGVESRKDSSQTSLKEQVMESLITNMFEAISSLKSAYVQLQSAHAPYDPDKLQMADKAVISELKKLSELKHSYRERMAAMASGQAQEESEGPVEVETKEIILKSYEGIISNFHTELQKKNAVVENLKDMLAQTTLKKEKLERRVKRLEQRLAKESVVKYTIDLSPTPQLLESTLLGASEAARSFTNLLISLMKTAQWDLDAAANSIEPDINYVRRQHKKYAFESYVCSRMLTGFESDDFYISGNLSSVIDVKQKTEECFKEFQDLRTADPVQVIHDEPESLFSKYCLKKFVDLVHPKMEESFFGNLDQRKQVQAGNHPITEFYHSYVKLARAMWLLHRLAWSFDPNACIFQVKRNTEFSPLYMESIVQMTDFDMSSSGSKPIVGFTVMPGFRVEKTVLKCQVYVLPGRPNGGV